MNKGCSLCGNTYFHIRAEDNVLVCHNGHVMHSWNGVYMYPVVIA